VYVFDLQFQPSTMVYPILAGEKEIIKSSMDEGDLVVSKLSQQISELLYRA
jgi:hypothetical protein